MKNKPSSIALLFLTAMIWGFAFVAQVVGGENVGTFTFNAVRFLIGAVVLIPVVIIFERGSKASTKYTVLTGMISGTVLCIASNLQQLGLILTGSPGKGGFITALYTFFVPIFASIFLKKRTGRNTWIGAVLAIFGLFLILSGSMDSAESPLFGLSLSLSAGKYTFTGALGVGFGDIVLILCAISFAVQIVFIDYCSDRISPIKFSCTQFFTAAIISFIGAFLFESPSSSDIGAALIPLLYSGIMSTGVAYTLQIIGQKGAHPTVAAIIMSTESMFAAIGGALILHEVLTIPAYTGCAVMMAGIIIAQIPSRSKR